MADKNRTNFPFFVIGIDIGGTKIAGAILHYKKHSQAPEIVFEDKLAAEAKKSVEVFTGNICKLANLLKDKAIQIDSSVPIACIGMGSAGRVNKISGSVVTATDNFPGFSGFPLTKTVSEKTGIPAYALNDVQAHTLGEARWGSGKDVDNFILLAVGTGIGGCAVLDGKLMVGSHGYAGEFGHAQVCLASDVKCPCGKTGHLEAISSGSGIERQYKIKTGKQLSGVQISKLANSGDEIAMDVIQTSGRCLGQIIAMYLSIFDPEIVILSGSVSKCGKIWYDSVLQGFNEEVIDEISQNLKLCEAKLGDSAAFIGAAEYALDRLGE